MKAAKPHIIPLHKNNVSWPGVNTTKGFLIEKLQQCPDSGVNASKLYKPQWQTNKEFKLK